MNNFVALTEQAKKFFTESGYDIGNSLLSEIAREQEDKSFRVCVAGEFSKGKTHFINTLLETKVFPESFLPTTSVLTEIQYGHEDKICFFDKEYSLNYENLAQFATYGIQANAQGILKVYYKHDVLKNSLLLYDTPGVSDVFEKRAHITFKALEKCDAAILAVSVLTPLSLSERAFIDTYLCEKAITKLAIVLTFVDTLPLKDIARQIEFTINKIHSLYPNAEIWCMDTRLPEDLCKYNSIEAIRARLYEWTCMPDKEERRAQRDLVRIKEAVKVALGQENILLKSLEGDISFNQENLDKAYDALEKESDLWHTLYTNFTQKASFTLKLLEESTHNLSLELISSLQKEGVNAFKASLRQVLLRKKKELALIFEKEIKKDIEELSHTLREKFLIEPTKVFNFSYKISLDHETLSQFENTQENNLISIFLDFASSFIVPVVEQLPLPLESKNLLSQLTQKFCAQYKNSSSSNKESMQELEECIITFCRRLENEMAHIVDSLYSNIADFLLSTQREWLRKQSQKMREIHGLKELEETKKQVLQNRDYGVKLSHKLKNNGVIL